VRQRTRGQIFAELADPPQLKWRKDPSTWVRDRARSEIWSRQREILEAVRDHERVAIPSCHSAGKSFTMGLLTCWWIDVHPVGEARVVSTAPTSKQVDAVLWNEINQHHVRIGLGGRTNKNEWYFGRYLAGLGRKPPDHVSAAFQGLHALYLLVIFDEAYGIPKHLWDEGSSLASNRNARMVAVGNPDGPGEFAEICKPGSGWYVIPISYRDTPNFTGEEVSDRLSDMLIAPNWVEDRRKKWGEYSALFQSKCEGKFPSEGSPWDVVPHSWASACRYLELPATGEIEAGIDVGAGNDRTVITIRQGDVVLDIHWFVNPDPVQTVGDLALHLRDWKVKRVKVDSIGVGWGVYGALREAVADVEVIPINVSMAPSTEEAQEKYLNRRAEMWWEIGRERCRNRQIDLSRLPEDTQDDLIHELSAPRYEILNSRGKIKIEAKEHIIERLGVSPDLAESLLLAFVPANWTAELQTAGLLTMPSFLDGLRPSDLTGRRSW
jgi:hypothetical protein